MDRVRAAYEAHRELAGVAIVAVVAHLGYGVLNQSAIPPYVAVSGWVPYIGEIYAAWLVAETIFKTPMGSLADLLGMRTVYVIASAVGTVSAFLWTVTHVLGIIFAVRVADGVASAGAWAVTVVAMGGSVKARSRTGAMGLYVVTYLAGLAFAPLVGGYANDATHSKLTSFYLASALLAVAALLALKLVPMHPLSDEIPRTHFTGARSLVSEIWLGLRSLPEYLAIAFAAFFSIGLLAPILKLFAMQELGLTETDYGLVVLPVIGVLTIGALSAAELVCIMGKDHIVQLGTSISAAAMYLMPWIHHLWELAALASVIGFGFAISMPAWLAIVSDMSAPEVRGSVIGAVGTGGGFGMLAGVTLGGYLYSLPTTIVFGISVRGHFAPFWASAVGLTICVALALLFVREGSGRYVVAPD